ncbi:hypothetical protein [Paraburkholderia sp. CI3]|uniref:hypothetical protein n=1 Tax=Paraburkholderia sp. CI3 TaxID=2991060 RepID=UPI003D19E33B
MFSAIGVVIFTRACAYAVMGKPLEARECFEDAKENLLLEEYDDGGSVVTDWVSSSRELAKGPSGMAGVDIPVEEH